MPVSRLSVADKRRVFHQKHQGGCFVIPNPWNVGSARCLQSLGFKALAATSPGFASSLRICRWLRSA
jgi:2-methylisocitrate lyase-like PEP mutase family enzyme